MAVIKTDTGPIIFKDNPYKMAELILETADYIRENHIDKEKRIVTFANNRGEISFKIWEA